MLLKHTNVNLSETSTSTLFSKNGFTIDCMACKIAVANLGSLVKKRIKMGREGRYFQLQ